MSTAARRVPRLIGGSGVVLLCVVVWYLTLAPATLGGPLSLVLVRGTSMEPTYGNGDLVIGYRTAALAPGDVAIFRGPGDAPVIHRVRELDGDRLLTRGDNLAVDDPWETRRSDVLGTARVHLRGVGDAIRLLGRPSVLGALAGALVLSLVLWRTQPPPGRSHAVTAVALVLLLGPVVVGRAASVALSADQLAAMTVPGPFETYLIASGGGGPGGGGGGGGAAGGGRP